MKIAMQKGYPDTNGKVHTKLADAQKAQSAIDLDKAVESLDGSTSIIEFIDKNPEVVREYMKYNCKKPKPAPKKKSTVKK